MIRYVYTILYVERVACSVAFYQKAFGFDLKFMTPDESYAELLTGATTLAFASKELANSNLKEGFQTSDLSAHPFGIELGFVVEDVPAAVERAQKAGATLTEAPKQKPWGQTVAYLRDTNGFLIELCTPMG
ncbi:Uncharacterized conserved protein PhnB, glyoxalase superfamily [Flexibacter flexilis DSM 6793]|uniref:Uncharacterized conserved protein PhnB, glyoxalase superfamily n=1 Tax=Flexibacter flexilis DSM 6793 TaxID=927664 RepID=A0A1I1L6C1_9BACT|nr:VOC family protein [Flexibacter flexilis]SFC68604.1 Uncharacterized conserved protein PhnB, glyoxalase superfamily [Flexibacter flexilis DSM 6793]